MAVGHGYPTTGGRGQMRAADADRDRAVGFLSTAYTEGRLGKDEYDARLESALSARTYADLDHLVSDLPVARVAVARPVARTNGLAVASLACGVAQFVLGPLPTIPAIVFGHLARHQIKRTGETGAGMALAGLLLGWAAVLLAVILIGIAAVVFTVHSGQAAHAYLRFDGLHHLPPPANHHLPRPPANPAP